jgi:IS1 family transposase
MRILPTEKRVAILHSLIEGVGVNATARLNGCSKVTVLRLLVDAGQFCADYHDLHVRNLATKRLQLDEVWAFVGCKQRTKLGGGEGHGDAWTWVALDADSRLVVAYHVGGHNEHDARHFLADAAKRVPANVQVTTDALKLYLPLVPQAFGDGVNHGVLVKHYGPPKAGDGTAAARYQPAVCIAVKKEAAFGKPDPHHCSTSYVERSHLALRTSNRRFVRLGIGYSKRLLNHEAAIALHHHAANFIRRNSTLKTTPAVAAGIATNEQTVAELVELIEREERLLGGRLTGYLPSAA